jgi:hypothetical protein
MVTQVHLTRGRLNRQRWVGEKIVCTVHTTLGGGFFVLLDSHFKLLE